LFIYQNVIILKRKKEKQIGEEMENSKNTVDFEEPQSDEINDIWDIFFPKASEKSPLTQRHEPQEQTKPRRYLKFLTM